MKQIISSDLQILRIANNILPRNLPRDLVQIAEFEIAEELAWVPPHELPNPAEVTRKPHRVKALEEVMEFFLIEICQIVKIRENVFELFFDFREGIVQPDSHFLEQIEISLHFENKKEIRDQFPVNRRSSVV